MGHAGLLFGAIFGMRQIRESPAEDVVGRSPHEFREGSVDTKVPTVEIHLDHAHGDLLEGRVEGWRLFDAPGLWEGGSELDLEASRRAREEMNHADLWILVIDGTSPATSPASSSGTPSVRSSTSPSAPWRSPT